MEHSVLNGSVNFPVKSPFDVLLKGSLSTFLNAFTSKDYTMYPVASMNDQDYYNLMHVYLDAVFNPLIYSDDRIFKQEGWHYELTDRANEVTFTGVVYNEMKGAFSNPQRELWYQVFRHLFPGHPYGFESGGHPASIPSLNRDEFIAFHRKFYHPGNSYIFLYGNADLLRELAFINESYLSEYSKPDEDITISDQEPFPVMKDITERYPLAEGADSVNQTFLTYNFLAGQNSDLALTMALDILCEVLVNQESAPVRKALQEAGIGQEVSASCSNFKQHVVQIAALNANPGDKLQFETIIKQTLTNIIRGDSVSEVMYAALDKLQKEGIRVESRNGSALSLYNTNLIVDNPRARTLHLNGRSSNVFQLIAETLWVASGSDVVDGFLEFFLPRAKQYSDDGMTWAGAYGPRMYAHDQFQDVLAAFEQDELRSVANPTELEKFKSVARATALKDRRINIRISSGDLQEIQVKALEEHFPAAEE